MKCFVQKINMVNISDILKYSDCDVGHYYMQVSDGKIKTYHFEKTQVVSERRQNPDEGNDEHDHTEHNEDNGGSQEHSFQCFVLLPLHLRIDADGQNKAPYQLKQITQIRSDHLDLKQNKITGGIINTILVMLLPLKGRWVKSNTKESMKYFSQGLKKSNKDGHY